MKVIEVNNLKKEFVSKKRITKPNGKKSLFKREKCVKNAVDGISFSVEEGEALAFIGPNGAGKSTTIKCSQVYFIRPRAISKFWG